MNKSITNSIYGESMVMSSESPSRYSQNREYLLSVIMKKLEISDDDLYNDTGWVKNKVRENNLGSLLEN
jgi:transcription initiation factor IIE alpha subunit